MNRKLLAVCIHCVHVFILHISLSFTFPFSFRHAFFVLCLSLSLSFQHPLGDKYPTTWYAAAHTLTLKTPAISRKFKHTSLFELSYLCALFCSSSPSRFSITFRLLDRSCIDFVWFFLYIYICVCAFFRSCDGCKIYDIYVCIIFVWYQPKIHRWNIRCTAIGSCSVFYVCTRQYRFIAYFYDDSQPASPMSLPRLAYNQASMLTITSNSIHTCWEREREREGWGDIYHVRKRPRWVF